MRNLFYNSAEQRLRAAWRVVATLGVFGILVVLGTIPLTVVYLSQFETPASIPSAEQIQTDPLVLAGSAVLSLIASAIAIWLSARFLDKRQLSDYGLSLGQLSWWRDLLFGAGLGALLMTFIFLVEQALGWVRITETFASPDDTAFWAAILLPVITFLCVGIYEELLFRGYQFINIAEGFNLPQLGERSAILLAWLLTSVFFGVAHALNPNATLLSTLYISFAGIMLGIGYVLSGSLAIPIGLHITWNFFQANVFGFPVSGMDRSATFLAIEQSGPELWTGGAFGPEGGLMGLLAMLVGTLAIALYAAIVRGERGLHRPIAVYRPRHTHPSKSAP